MCDHKPFHGNKDNFQTHGVCVGVAILWIANRTED